MYIIALSRNLFVEAESSVTHLIVQTRMGCMKGVWCWWYSFSCKHLQQTNTKVERQHTTYPSIHPQIQHNPSFGPKPHPPHQLDQSSLFGILHRPHLCLKTSSYRSPSKFRHRTLNSPCVTSSTTSPNTASTNG